MIKFNYLTFSFFLSVFIHFVLIYQLQKSKEVDEIYVVDLSSYKEFRPKKIQVQKPITKEIKKLEKPKKIIQKKPVEKKLEKKIAIKKKQKEEPLKKIEKVEETKELQRNEELEKIKKVEEIIEKKNNSYFNQNKTIENNKKKLLIDKQIKSFLIKVSDEINRLAIKSYPIQSIKRREQGTIVAIVSLNSDGDLVDINFESKRPKRLYEKTKQILQSYKFPNPPAIIFEKNELLSIKIPVNYILK